MNFSAACAAIRDTRLQTGAKTFVAPLSSIQAVQDLRQSVKDRRGKA